MIRCPVCGTQNAEPAEVCRNCAAVLNASPTVSISSGVSESGGTAVAPVAPASHPSSTARGFTPGSLVADRYRVVSLLGRGGMGEVYSADDLKLGQRVALKFLPPERGKSSSWREQFYAEVRMARQVSHPNVCRVYDVGESDGQLFISMEFVDGEDLASLLRRIGHLPGDKAVEVAQQLCAGLAAAHHNGVLHRDLKPSNVMLDGKGHARITDFGLAIIATEAGREHTTAGTPGYVAPELLAGSAPSIQSDLYALGLVLYEVFTGKKAFDAASLAELCRKQTETNPTPPSSVVKNLDPAVERAILRCLERDPAQRPRSSQSVAAALPGGDPLEAAMAAGETPSPEMVAAAGPEGSLRPAVAWAYLVGAVVLTLGTSMFLSPRLMDWGLVPMNKSPEVLADRAQELALKLGYPTPVDQASWIDSEKGYLDYARKASGKDRKQAIAREVWPSPVSFWYRQSPRWMMPLEFQYVTAAVPPYETSGMATLKLDMQGKLVFLRGVPPQVESGSPSHDPDWNLLFAEAGLDKGQFTAASSKWLPPEAFDSRADWEGHLAERPDVPLHVTAAAYRGAPVYFQVIAPWDKPWRADVQGSERLVDRIAAATFVVLLICLLVVGAFFARRNILRGRGDTKGALRLAAFVALAFGVNYLSSCHFVPRPGYIVWQFMMLGLSLFLATLGWIGYMAVEPYARRNWPKVMISWQRLLSGRFRDPLVGRDVLLGILAGAATAAVFGGVLAWAQNSSIGPVSQRYGQGLLPSIGGGFGQLAITCFMAILFLALLTMMTGLLRRRWLGLIATGLISVLLNDTSTLLVSFLSVIYAVVFLTLLTRAGLLACTGFVFILPTLLDAPPLIFGQWYAGRAVIALLLPLVLLVWGFYASLGGQPILGSALKEE